MGEANQAPEAVSGSVLAGLRVIDASTGMAGPIAGMFLADFGADVVKVEAPGGDPSRAMAGSVVWNRGKRSAVFDPEDQASATAFEELVRNADVLITNEASPSASAGNPRLVHLVVPAYLAGAPWPSTVESEGLLAAVMGTAARQGSVGGGPVDGVVPVLSIVHGVWAATATLAALIERERSALGQVVTVAGAHAAMVSSSVALNFDPSVPAPDPVGASGGSVPFYRTYQCGDGEWLFLAALTPRFTELAFSVLGVSELYDDPRLEGRGRAGMLDRDNAVWVRQRIAEVFRTASREEWLARLHEVGCPSGPVLGRDDWLDHPQLGAIGMRVEIDDPVLGEVVMPGVPVTLHATPGSVRSAAPPPPTGDAAPWSGPAWEVPPSRLAEEADGDGDGANGSGSTPRRAGPLSWVKVVDLGAIIAGPFAGSLLGELGASVVKVEPLTGDSFRGPGFAAYNKGQRSMAVDLRRPEGRDALLAVIAGADIVIDNYRPGVLARLGLEYDDVSQVAPAVVSVSITGFGDRGPLGGAAGFDPVLQAMSGMMAAQGGDGEPVYSTIPVNDVTAAASTSLGALLALLHRVRTGNGQKVSTSLTAMSALLQAGEIVRFEGRPPAPVGGRDHRGVAPLDRYYEASDGWVRVLAPAGADADAVLSELGIEGADDATVAAWVAQRSCQEAIRELGRAGIAAVRVRLAHELVDDDAIVAAGIVAHDQRPGRAGQWTTGTFAHFARTPLQTGPGAPALGEHTVDVLAGAGYPSAEVEALLAAGVVAAAKPRERARS